LYPQWHRKYVAGGTGRYGKNLPSVARLQWVCGVEPALVNEVVYESIRLSQVRSENIVRMDGTAHSITQVWDEACQLPVTDPYKLVYVTSAERLDWQDHSGLGEWVSLAKAGQVGDNMVLLVSGEADFTYLEDRAAGKRPLAPHLALLHTGLPEAKGGSEVVRCNTLPIPAAVAWIKRQRPMSDESATYLLTRVDGDLMEARNAALKMSLFPGEPTRPVIDAFAPAPVHSYVEALTFGDLSGAMSTAQALDGSPDEDRQVARIIGMLDTRLEVLGRLHRLVRSKGTASGRDLGKERISMAEGRRLLARSGHYSPTTRVRARNALAMADAARRTGAAGVLEALALTW
jgi:alkylated DNA nucleotide flippase Atl1